MAISLGFNNSGANPLSNAPSNAANPFAMSGSTSASKALTAAQSPNMSTVNGPKYSPPPSMPTAPTNQSVVSHSVTDSQGNTTTQKYAPTSGLVNQTPTGAPNQTVAPGAGTPGYTYTNGILTSVGGQFTGGAQTYAPGTPQNGGNITQANGQPNLPTPPAPTTSTTPSGAVVDSNGGLVSGPTSTSSTTYPGLINSLSTFNPFANSNVSDPYKQAQELNTQLQQSKTNEANSVAQNRLNPIPIGDQTGREAVIKNQYLDQQTALAGQLQGESNLYSAGLTGTGQQLSGLNTATSASAPIQSPYSNQVLNPQTGQPINGSTSNALTTAVQNAITQIKNGSGYANAAATLGSFGPAGTNALLSALGPNFNINSSNAQAAAQASNINTQGTLNTNIGAQGVQQATQNYVAANTAYQTADAQSKNLQSTLASTGINNNPQFLNQKINSLQNQLGSANYTSFITALNETKQAYTNLLSSVGAATPTVNGQQATEIFDANSTPAQINAAITALNTAAYAKLKPLYDQIGTYSSIGSGGSNSSGSGTVQTSAGAVNTSW